ncbi:hypothetical protein D3C85_1640870 [compost metagenome]
MDRTHGLPQLLQGLAETRLRQHLRQRLYVSLGRGLIARFQLRPEVLLVLEPIRMLLDEVAADAVKDVGRQQIRMLVSADHRPCDGFQGLAARSRPPNLVVVHGLVEH